MSSIEMIEIDPKTGEVVVYGNDPQGLCEYCDRRESCDHHQIDCLIPCG